MIEMLHRELIYIGAYFSIQFQQIFIYWVMGMVIGSAVSVFAKDWIHRAFLSLRGKHFDVLGIFISSALGILSPLCMYGTIPIAASFYRNGIRQDWLAAFMMSSVLLNPQLIVYSSALGTEMVIIRILLCYLCGVTAGVLLRVFYRGKVFFDFKNISERMSHDTAPNIFVRYLLNLWRNVKSTGVYFLLGIFLSALFQRYVPSEIMTDLFQGNEAWGVLMAATIGVPLYACGGGTIPLLQEWLWSGMSYGSATAFMLTGPATKITNLGALKIVMGIKRFGLYLAYVMCFAFLSGFLINLIFI